MFTNCCSSKPFHHSLLSPRTIFSQNTECCINFSASIGKNRNCSRENYSYPEMWLCRLKPCFLLLWTKKKKKYTQMNPKQAAAIERQKKLNSVIKREQEACAHEFQSTGATASNWNSLRKDPNFFFFLFFPFIRRANPFPNLPVSGVDFSTSSRLFAIGRGKQILFRFSEAVARDWPRWNLPYFFSPHYSRDASLSVIEIEILTWNKKIKIKRLILMKIQPLQSNKNWISKKIRVYGTA